MKKFLIIAGLMFTVSSYSQKKGTGVILHVEPNGVVVHKPVDVEHTLGIKSDSVQQTQKQSIKTNSRSPRTMDDFSVEELEDMLYYADLKIEKIKEEGNAEDLKYYVEQKQLIEEKLRNHQNKK